MSETIRVYVNADAVELPAGSDARAAVGAADPALAARLDDGRAYVTDGRGIELDPASPLRTGAILRVVTRARRGGEEPGAHG